MVTQKKSKLKKEQIDRFKVRLLEMRSKLQNHLEESTAEVQKPDEATGYSQHQADEGTDDYDRTLGIQLTSRDFDVLRQIDRALEKIEENTYGVCDVSGDSIPLKRLEAFPHAIMTVDVQEKYEQGIL